MPVIQMFGCVHASARLAQSAERKVLNLVVVGSSPTVGFFWFSVFQVRFSNLIKRWCYAGCIDTGKFVCH